MFYWLSFGRTRPPNIYISLRYRPSSGEAWLYCIICECSCVCLNCLIVWCLTGCVYNTPYCKSTPYNLAPTITQDQQRRDSRIWTDNYICVILTKWDTQNYNKHLFPQLIDAKNTNATCFDHHFHLQMAPLTRRRSRRWTRRARCARPSWWPLLGCRVAVNRWRRTKSRGTSFGRASLPKVSTRGLIPVKKT